MLFSLSAIIQTFFLYHIIFKRNGLLLIGIFHHWVRGVDNINKISMKLSIYSILRKKPIFSEEQGCYNFIRANALNITATNAFNVITTNTMTSAQPDYPGKYKYIECSINKKEFIIFLKFAMIICYFRYVQQIIRKGSIGSFLYLFYKPL